jgi:predicted CXXCH cytochrome family protein
MIQIITVSRPLRYHIAMNKSFYLMPLLAAATGLLTGAPAFACNVCHSKNPKMVRMHEALEYKECFKCHGPASSRPDKDKQNERTTGPLCVNCHQNPAQK